MGSTVHSSQAGSPLDSVALVVIAKYPIPGKVKTRLMTALSAETAAAVHGCFLRHVVWRLYKLKPAELFVYFDPIESRDAMHDLLGMDGDVSLIPQKAGDLGHRLANVATVVAKRHERCLILAVDSPDVPDDHIITCANTTRDAQVVLGLADDGGYWCIGVRSDVDAAALLHSGIEWSTNHTAAHTLAAARRLNYSVFANQQWDDIDHPNDLRRLMSRLPASTNPDDLKLYRELLDLLPPSFHQMS
jgi:rSAM/selenodomain-associated transferase 1